MRQTGSTSTTLEMRFAMPGWRRSGASRKVPKEWATRTTSLRSCWVRMAERLWTRSAVGGKGAQMRLDTGRNSGMRTAASGRTKKRSQGRYGARPMPTPCRKRIGRWEVEVDDEKRLGGR